MKNINLTDLYMDAHYLLEEMQDMHHGDQFDDNAKIVAAVAAIILKNMKEDK